MLTFKLLTVGTLFLAAMVAPLLFHDDVGELAG